MALVKVKMEKNNDKILTNHSAENTERPERQTKQLTCSSSSELNSSSSMEMTFTCACGMTAALVSGDDREPVDHTEGLVTTDCNQQSVKKMTHRENTKARPRRMIKHISKL